VEHFVPFALIYVNKMYLKIILLNIFSHFCNNGSINKQSFVTIAQYSH
jgi:hypothetical protein